MKDVIHSRVQKEMRTVGTWIRSNYKQIYTIGALATFPVAPIVSMHIGDIYRLRPGTVIIVIGVSAIVRPVTMSYCIYDSARAYIANREKD
jgi:hypothetical protein